MFIENYYFDKLIKKTKFVNYGTKLELKNANIEFTTLKETYL